MTFVTSQNTFEELLTNTIAFDPIPDDEEFYLPSTQNSSSSTSPFPSDFVIFSQNAQKSNTITHSILSIASSMRPPADIILIQEPYYGKIGTNPQMAQGNPIFNNWGCPKHKDWQALLPSTTSPSSPPDVMAYVPSQHPR